MPSSPARPTADVALAPDTRCLSLRRVNPFQGLAALVQTPGGRALSVDGRHWQIQILAHPPRGLWSGGGEQKGLRYFRFGFWSSETGTTRVPLNPILDAGEMVAASERLVAQVREAEPSLPFPLAPELEQWLLDPSGNPLALLATALDTAELDELRRDAWNAGAREDERPFISKSLSARDVAERGISGRHVHVEALERLVAEAAAPHQTTRWFRREGAYAVALDQPADAETSSARLPEHALPPLTLRTDWADRDARLLVDEYIAWLSPYLLTLPDLDDEARAGLERSAAHHAPLVDSLWRLYPRIIDEGLIRQARVEARLRESTAA